MVNRRSLNSEDIFVSTELNESSNQPTSPDLVVWSHLRWDFVYQRPQHLLKRAAKDRRVFFMEEPIYNGSMHLDVRERDNGVLVITPHLPAGLNSDVATQAVLREMFHRYFVDNNIREYVFWYYT